MNVTDIRKQYPQYADMPDEQLVIGLHRKYYADIPFKEFHKQIQYNAPDPTEGMSGMRKAAAGYGQAIPNLVRGVGQLVGTHSQADVDEARKLDAALLKSGAGMAGNIAGNAALFAPTAFIPGANTYIGAGAIGSAIGAAQPVATGESRAMNVGLGAGAGVAGQAAGNALGRAIRPVKQNLSAEQQALAQAATREGIPLSAGQATGSRPLQTIESVMENLPLTSGPQLAGREAQQRAYTAAALRRAGITADTAAPEVLAVQKAALGGTIGDIAKRNKLDFNKGLTDKLAGITDDAAQHLPPDLAGKVGGTVDKVLSQVDNTGNMAGTNYQGWREPLRGLSTNTETGRNFQAIRRAMDESFQGQLGGAEGETLRKASREYANLKTIMNAAGGPGAAAASNQIAPAQLSAAVRQAMGKEGVALGRGDLNELSRIGTTFVRDQIPNSGTAQRQFIQNLLTTGGGAGTGALGAGMTGHDPWAGAAIGAGVGAGALAAPRVAQMAMNSSAGQSYLKQGLMGLTEAQRNAITMALRTGALGNVPALAQ